MAELQDEVFRTVLESLGTGLYILDRERKIVFWNQGAEKITGYQRHEVVGHLSRENILAHCNDVSCVLCGTACPVSQALLGGQRGEIQISLRHKAGHRVPVRLQAIPIRDSHGSVVYTAESFVEEYETSDLDTHRNNLAAHGCLDVLTGTPNHAFTLSHLRENLIFFQEYDLHFGLLCIEIREIDELRARHGREAVDVMLHVVAQTMKHTLRPDGFLGRWSENLFLAIMTYCENQELEKAARSVEKMVSCSGIQWWDDLLTVSVAVGHAMVRPGDTVESLLERARQALGRGLAKSAAAAASSAHLPGTKG
jgi:diguanylate cyclase (GGDEF)-like protein/PAS domain S-box-containing protein